MQPQSANKKLSPSRFRNLILGTALTVATVVAANTIVLTELRRDTLNDVEGDLLRQSLTLSELVERTIQSVDLVLASVVEKIRVEVSADGDVERLSDKRFQLFLSEKIPGLPQIDALGVLDARGIRINHSRDWPSDHADLSQREYFKAVKSNPQATSFVGEPVQGAGGDAWTFVLARPVVTTNGKFIGVVTSSARLNYFDDLFRTTALGEGYAATLMRSDGMLLARYPKAGTIGSVQPASILKKFNDSRFAISRSTSPVDHQARIAAAYQVGDFPLVVIVTQSEDAAFAAWRAMAVMMSAITAAMVLLVGVAAHLIARSLLQRSNGRSVPVPLGDRGIGVKVVL